MNRLIPLNKIQDIPEKYGNIPVQSLIEYQNFNRKNDDYQKAQLLIAMCMDNRKYLRIPPNFAYIIRTGGGNLRLCDFFVSYAIAIGKVSAIALIAHNDCGMADLFSIQKKFVEGLVQHAGWDQQQATEHFLHDAPLFEIGNEIDFVLSEAARLRLKYPKIPIIPLFYQLEDHLLYGIKEDSI